jgi:hypothetical protein
LRASRTANPIGWLKKGEAWVSAATWLNAIFEGNEEDATRAAQLMRDAGLLRTQNSCSLHDHTIQCVTTIKGRPRRIYVVRRADLKGYLHGKYNTAQLNLDRKLIGFPINRPSGDPTPQAAENDPSSLSRSVADAGFISNARFILASSRRVINARPHLTIDLFMV